MGSGASKKGGQAPDAQGTVDPALAHENFTWAAKTDKANLKSHSSDADDGPLGGAGRGAHGRGNNERVMLIDAEDDSDIEIICEGKKQRVRDEAASAANGQEAPMEAMPEAQAKPTAAQQAQQEISQRQKEEAAKLAEQRKRFDNQRYQRELAAAGGGSGPAVTTSPSCASLGSGGFGGDGACPHQRAPEAAPRHELVMGLNLTAQPEQGQQGDPLIEDCLPGGVVGDTPRLENKQQPVKVTNNNHDVFDDDDEELMKEILESVDA